MYDVMKYFSYAHLPSELAHVSKRVYDLAAVMQAELPECEQKAVGMQKLLEAKDCFVRSVFEKE